MWHDSRRGFNLIRNRANVRKAKLKRMELVIIAICIMFVSIAAIYGIISVVNSPQNRGIAVNTGEVVKYNNSQGEVATKRNEGKPKEIIETNNDELIGEKKQEESEGIKITALGEIMMGGNKFKSANYALSFKEISSYLEKSDYTISTLATNITSVNDLSNTKTRYIVNESITNAFSALNIDGINIATDHMLDFSKNMFNFTIDTLKENDIDIIGLENDIAYAEKNGTRIAFIGVNNVVIGNAKNYIDSGVFIYNLGKLKNSINEAKTKADTVIVMTHYGKENVYEVTDVMSWFAKEIIRAGADMVLGSHALGIYPIEEYEGKLIVYSLGYLMHDTTKELGKKSGIFDISVKNDGTIESLELTPTYIDGTFVKLYKEVDQNKNSELLNELKSKSILHKYSANIDGEKLIIKLNK